MGGTRKPYPVEFRNQMVELVRAGRSPSGPDLLYAFAPQRLRTSGPLENGMSDVTLKVSNETQ